MSLPSPAPVDALYTWGQLRYLLEKGIIVEPLTYAGLTTLGLKLIVRRRIVHERHGRSFLTNKLTLQSVIITDSVGSVPATPSGRFMFSHLPGDNSPRLINPKTSSKTLYLTRAIIGTNALGAITGLLGQPQIPAQAAKATNQSSEIHSLVNDSTFRSVASLSSDNTGAIVGPAIRAFAANPSIYDMTGWAMPPNSSIDMTSGSLQILEWFEQ